MLPPNAIYELRARAWRILSMPEGKFEATKDAPLVKAALDGLMVLAQDAIEYHAKEERLGIRWQLKGLGWFGRRCARPDGALATRDRPTGR